MVMSPDREHRVLRAALSLRFVMLVASVGAGIGAVLMFWEGGTEIAEAAASLVAGDDRRAVVTSIMHGIDAFLFGMVLVIFAYAITFGFVFDATLQGWQTLPGWMRISSVSELKNTLVEVILLYLLVDFATDVPGSEGELTWTILAKPLAILAIALAFGVFAMLHALANRP
jgi:uncharacterized membrane protein YqhA